MKSPLNKHKLLNLLTSAVILLILISTLGCSNTQDSYGSLRNQGVLPLSQDNAYLGSNLFLAQEFEKSTHLFNFLKGRGAPNAIELKESGFGKAQLKLFYPQQKEFYIADLISSETTYQWIVRGPFRIERHLYRDLAGLFDQGVSEPQFTFNGKPFRFKPTAEEILLAAKLAVTPMPRVTSKPKIKSGKTSITTKLADAALTPLPTLAPTPFKPLTYDQQAIAMAQGFAERAANGDVVHTVKVETETIEQIAQWYTGSATNASSILQSNGITAGTGLKTGIRIQIPLALVKQFKRM
jgi:hypothetical protein